MAETKKEKPVQKSKNTGAKSPLFFDSTKVVPRHRYVVWLDALGTRSALLVSHARAANFVMRIHASCLHARANTKDIILYPMNDGVFILSEDLDALRTFLASVMRLLARTFMNEAKPEHRFMVRGAVAFGAVSTGDNLHGGNPTLQANQEHIQRIVLGMPLAQAVEAERFAPPYGIIVHESARLPPPTNGKSWSVVLWRWWGNDSGLGEQLGVNVMDHLDWAEKNPIASMYPEEAIKRHRKAALEYFPGKSPNKTKP